MPKHPHLARTPIQRALRLSCTTPLLLLAACDWEAPQGSVHYSLNPSTHATLADADLYGTPEGTAAQIEGALDMLVGTAAEPQFLVLEKWQDAEFDPNYGQDELDDAALEEVARDNERRFATQLDALRADRFDEVRAPRYGADLWQQWLRGYADLVADPNAEAELGDGSKGTRKEAAIDLFVHWYPTLRESASLYRQQCLHCHGVEGGGNGPTAEFLEPRPRDYRLGLFKWSSVAWNQRPVRSDLYQLIRNGVNGTAMPPFARFSRGELEGLVDYVRLLAVRGETESLMAVVAGEEGALSAAIVEESYDTIWDRWQNAAQTYTAVAGEVPRSATPESVEKGRQLFGTAPANCFTCHGVDGVGDGEAQYEPSTDGSLVKKKDNWGNPSQPRNFHQAILRGGSRPIDLYRRVKNGISGTIMPAADASLSDDDIWALVHYVQYMVQQHDVARRQEAKLAHAANSAEHAPSAHSETPASGH